MSESPLSAAITTYIWGDRTLSRPSKHPEVLTEEQRVFLPLIERVLATAFVHDPTGNTLEAVNENVQSILRTAYPELTEEAIHAVGTYYCFCWK